MGFVGTHNIILDEDVIFDKKSVMTYQQKIEDISSYRESPGVEIIKPTIEICNLFKDKIFYTLPVINISKIEKYRLEQYSMFPNKYNYTSIDDVSKHLEDSSKIYLLVKIVSCVSPKIFSLYVYEKSNISNIRDEKINSILNENNSM